MPDTTEHRRGRSVFGRAVRIAAAIVVLTLVGIGVWAWLSSGEDQSLPFEYGGFD